MAKTVKKQNPEGYHARAAKHLGLLGQKHLDAIVFEHPNRSYAEVLGSRAVVSWYKSRTYRYRGQVHHWTVTHYPWEQIPYYRSLPPKGHSWQPGSDFHSKLKGKLYVIYVY